MQGRQLQDARRQFSHGQAVKIVFNGWTQIQAGVGDYQRFPTEPDRSGAGIGEGFEANGFSPKENFRTDAPRGGLNRLCAESLPLTFQPGGIAFGEGLPGGKGTSSRNRHSRDTVTSEPKHVTPRPRIAHIHQGDVTLASQQSVGCAVILGVWVQFRVSASLVAAHETKPLVHLLEAA